MAGSRHNFVDNFKTMTSRCPAHRGIFRNIEYFSEMKTIFETNKQTATTIIVVPLCELIDWLLIITSCMYIYVNLKKIIVDNILFL